VLGAWWVSGVVGWWCCGSVVLWVRGAVGQWCAGLVVLWVGGVKTLHSPPLTDNPNA